MVRDVAQLSSERHLDTTSKGGRVTVQEQRRAKIPTKGQPLPLPKSAADARRFITHRESEKFSKCLGTEAQFTIDQLHEDYPAAFVNYHDGLWNWVWRLTPPDVIASLNEAVYALPDTEETAGQIVIAQHDYLWWRANFVEGMTAGKGFDAEHYEYFGEYANEAKRLGDRGVFDAAKQRRWNAKKAKVQIGRTSMERQLKYCLLVSWLAGGLWKMGSRDEQFKTMKRFFPQLQSYSPGAIQKAQKRLGLWWTGDRTNRP